MLYWCRSLIAQFPIPQHDELLGSVLARFIKCQGIRDDKVALDVLFGNRKIVPSPLLQGHIGELHTNVGHVWRIQPIDIVERHTLLPLFKPFLPADRYNMLLTNLIEQKLNTGTLRTGMNASIMKWPSQYHICPDCWRDQLHREGYSYWQRLFQCPGVESCPEHGIRLISTKILLGSDRRHYFTGAEGVQMPSGKVTPAECKQLQLSSMVRQLLDQSLPAVTPLQWSSFYHRLARKADCRDGAKINHEKIEQKIQSYWRRKWLESHGLGLQEKPNWLTAIFRKHRRLFTYLQHIVVWLALLPEHISAIDIIAEARALPEHCVPSHQDRYKQSESNDTRVMKREAWREILAEDKNVTLKAIRQTQQGARLYSWLYRFDNQWLLQHNPTPVKNYVNKRVDWVLRDRQLVKQFLTIEAKSFEVLELPRRSRAWFCNQLGVKSLVEKRLDSLPLCNEFFIRYAESIEEYQTRRLACIMAELEQKNEHLRPVCEIERLAGLSRQRSRKPAREILRMDIPTWQRTESFSAERSPSINWYNSYQKLV